MCTILVDGRICSIYCISTLYSFGVKTDNFSDRFQNCELQENFLVLQLVRIYALQSCQSTTICDDMPPVGLHVSGCDIKGS